MANTPNMTRPFKVYLHNKPITSYDTLDEAVTGAKGIELVYGPGGIVIDQPLDFGDSDD